ncbi:hypothetical protein ACH5RR_019212 [Cinchona calisaya]|uniref:ELP1 first N-terminal beta-propeller domain-containing protein n=1 Tax=Cinchona calisaya TaxID=153742 RepID=A0ABD2ZQ00_9GENT
MKNLKWSDSPHLTSKTTVSSSLPRPPSCTPLTLIASPQEHGVQLHYLQQLSLFDLEPGDNITSMDYLMEKEALIIGTSYGLLLLYIVDDNTMEVVGREEGGVKCISLSPDGDLFGIIMGFGQMLVMMRDWDLLYEMALVDHPEDVNVYEPTVSFNYSCESPISWQGDGKFFATLSKVHDVPSLHRNLKSLGTGFRCTSLCFRTNGLHGSSFGLDAQWSKNCICL